MELGPLGTFQDRQRGKTRIYTTIATSVSAYAEQIMRDVNTNDFLPACIGIENL